MVYRKLLTQFKKQFIVTSNASGQIVITAGTNETFNALSNSNYTITVLDDGSGWL